jgi:Cys-tRNA(Pro)/Cys-tRNA(Cys) deacylase
MTKGATPALRALDRAAVPYRVHEYEHDPAAGGYGEEAARALGVDPGRVFKTLVASCDELLVVAMVPVLGNLDLKAVAAAARAKRALMADARVAERVTGYIVGAISPIGQKRALPTFVDESASSSATIFCSGGRRGLEIELAPADLIRLTAAVTAPIAAVR